MVSKSITDRAECMKICTQQAVKAFDVPTEEQLSVRAWEQLYGSTGCGFGGFHGQAITRALVVAIRPIRGNSFDGPLRIYVDSKFAYSIDAPNEKYKEDMLECRLMNASSYVSEYEQSGYVDAQK